MACPWRAAAAKNPQNRKSSRLDSSKGRSAATLRPLPTLMIEGKGGRWSQSKPRGHRESCHRARLGPLECGEWAPGGQHQVWTWKIEDQELWQSCLSSRGRRESNGGPRAFHGHRGSPGAAVGAGSPRGQGGPERSETYSRGIQGRGTAGSPELSYKGPATQESPLGSHRRSSPAQSPQ